MKKIILSFIFALLLAINCHAATITFDMPDSVISAFAVHCSYYLRQVSNPDYQPEMITNPAYDPNIGQFILNESYDPEDPNSSDQYIIDPLYQELTIDNPLYDPNIPQNIDYTQDMHFADQIKWYVGEILKYEQRKAGQAEAVPEIKYTIGE